MEAYKVVLLGSSGTGAKTSLIRYILGLPFDKNIGVTMGANFTRYKLGENNLEVWDTAGQEKFKSLTKIFYKNAHCIILGFDYTSRFSFQEIKEYYYQEVKKELGDFPLIYLVGNKIDLWEHFEIEEKDPISYANKVNIKYFGISAKTGFGVKELLDDISHSLSKFKTKK